MLLINLIFEFCVVIVQASCTPRAWLPSDLATSPLVCNLYLTKLYELQRVQFPNPYFSQIAQLTHLSQVNSVHIVE